MRTNMAARFLLLLHVACTLCVLNSAGEKKPGPPPSRPPSRPTPSPDPKQQNASLLEEEALGTDTDTSYTRTAPQVRLNLDCPNFKQFHLMVSTCALNDHLNFFI